MPRVDLNADVGESFGAWTMGDDRALMESITSANIACGGHAGDPVVMRRTVRLAREHGVAVGAHPGFADLQGFGRRELRMAPDDVEALVLSQVGALAAIARAEGVALRHVKPHGALYNMAARDTALADAIARAVKAFDPGLVLFGLSGSLLIQAGEAAGLRTASEVFADRAYLQDGGLVDRTVAGAVVHDATVVVDRAVQMVRDGSVVAANGARIGLRAETICLHGDTPGAAALAREVRRGLEAHGVEVRAFA